MKMKLKSIDQICREYPHSESRGDIHFEGLFDAMPGIPDAMKERFGKTIEVEFSSQYRENDVRVYDSVWVYDIRWFEGITTNVATENEKGNKVVFEEAKATC